MSRLYRVVTLVIGFIVGFGIVLYLNKQHIFHPSIEINRFSYPITGIDVSSHNGNINFHSVAADGYSFVFIKASEGINFRDGFFQNNCKKAAEAGLKIGAYHFFRKNRDGVQQADNFIEATKGINLDLPLVVDVEDWENDNDIEPDVAARRLADMIGALEKQGKQVMIYTNGDGYSAYYLAGNYNRLSLWLCAFKEPEKIQHIPHDFQQYSHWGKVNGIKGDVDLNVFNGNKQQWLKFLEKSKRNPTSSN